MFPEWLVILQKKRNKLIKKHIEIVLLLFETTRLENPYVFVHVVGRKSLHSTLRGVAVRWILATK